MPGSLWSPKLTELISQLLLWHYEFALQIWKCKHDRYVTPDNGTETCSKHDDSSAIFLNTCQANDLPPAARPAKSFALRVEAKSCTSYTVKMSLCRWKLHLQSLAACLKLHIWSFIKFQYGGWSSPTCSLSPAAGGEMMREGVATGMVTGGAAGTLGAADEKASNEGSKHPIVKSLLKVSHL